MFRNNSNTVFLVVIHILGILSMFFAVGCNNPKTTIKDQVPAVPPEKELNRPFGKHDEEAFRSPPKVYHPETWFHWIGGNIGIEGITTDLEAIAEAGFSGIQLFHVYLGNEWKAVTPQVATLSDVWEDAVRHTAEECRRLGLRFTKQNCPGWAMSGGPWIEPSDAMRHLAWNRTDAEGGTSGITLAKPQPSREPWRDYKDVAVLAFPTPLDDTGEPLKPQYVKSNLPELAWMDCLTGNLRGMLALPAATEHEPNWVEITFPEATTVRTIEFPSVRTLNPPQWLWVYEPGVSVTIHAVFSDSTTRKLFQFDMPQSNWQDDRPLTIACPEINDVQTYRISFASKRDITLGAVRMFSAARKNNWESEAAWILRSIVRETEHPKQSQAAFINPTQILDITAMMDEQGHLHWDVPSGKWTILRIGHVNSGKRNFPAPLDATGWECDKLSQSGADVHFSAYIGRLAGQDGPLAGGLLNGMLLDSWECGAQTWTKDMEVAFERISEYPLRQWLPAIFGYVVGDHETTARFLRDWRATINDLFVHNYYGRMAQHAKDNGLTLSYETSGGDSFPADILEYFKFADIPMCEFWLPFDEGGLGSMNFRPAKPTASAARMYGKPRVSAESFTSLSLTWDENWCMFKEAANINSIEGVTHYVFHTYTHNPQTDFLPPGTSFARSIGSPFLRGQTWWKYMPEFISYLSRCTYMFERGKPVSDVLWYLGDEINHKPDQHAPFPEGFKYDYCNPDVLLNRISVRNGMLFTPEDIRYRALWLPDNQRMLPQTLEKLYMLVRNGATIIGDPPHGLATLSDATVAQKRFDTAVKKIWSETLKRGVRKLGKGFVISGMTIDEALNEMNIKPDVTGGDALWIHRRIEGADWYYVCAPKGKGFTGTLSFRNNTGNAEIWDPVSGVITPAKAQFKGKRTFVTLDLAQTGSCFVVFRKKGTSKAERLHSEFDTYYPSNEMLHQVQHDNLHLIPLESPWTLVFPDGWGAPSTLQIDDLKAWKDLDVSDEAKAFSGTVTYTTTFDAGDLNPAIRCTLDLGRIEVMASVSLNGKPVRTVWTPPYRVDLTDAVKPGVNTLTVEVTGTWFNRLVYDAGQPEENRKTWTINAPAKEEVLRESGLLGPVLLKIHKN